LPAVGEGARKNIGAVGVEVLAVIWLFQRMRHMAGLGNNPVQGFSALRDLHWEFLRLWAGFELPSSCRALPCYAADLNRSGLDFMRCSDFGLGAQDLNDIKRPKSFQKIAGSKVLDEYYNSYLRK
jgi:hypothetical protein